MNTGECMNTSGPVWQEPVAAAYAARRRDAWNKVARERAPLVGNDVPKKRRFSSTALHQRYVEYLQRLYAFLIPPGSRVLELGCGEGDLLAALKPSFGVGVDFSPAMLERARAAYPELHFINCDAHLLEPATAPELLDEPFDAIILSDLINDAWDVHTLLTACHRFCAPHTRLFVNFHSWLWEHPFKLLMKLGLVSRRLEQNWITPDDMRSMFTLAGYRVISDYAEYLCPLRIPFVETFCNRYLAKIWPFSIFDIFHVQVARPAPAEVKRPSVSVVIPARNEAGNIEDAILRTPEMGGGTELIFVEGNSSDDTWAVIQEMAAKYPARRIKTLRQPGKGKGDAVRAGFAAAEGDILMILDADLTMPPETLPQFYEPLASGQAEFVNGVRLVYPQEKEAMRFCNLVGNKFFSLVFSWLLGRRIKDTLCGTKAMSRENYLRLAANRLYFGDFDPFGDFDLLFGAAKLNLEIRDIPVRYRERTYGTTNISRWRDGLILLKMTGYAARRIKFVP